MCLQFGAGAMFQLLIFAGEYIYALVEFGKCINASCFDSYLPFGFPVVLSLPKAIAQAHSQLLLGSCNFESNTCGFTDGEFTSWSLHKNGIGILCFYNGRLHIVIYL